MSEKIGQNLGRTENRQAFIIGSGSVHSVNPVRVFQTSQEIIEHQIYVAETLFGDPKEPQGISVPLAERTVKIEKAHRSIEDRLLGGQACSSANHSW